MTPRRSRGNARQTRPLDHDNPLAEVYEDQLQAADLVVLNKTDLLDDATIARLRARDRWHGRRARCGWCRRARAGWIRPCCSGWARRRRMTWRRARRTTTRWTARTSTTISKAFVVALPEFATPEILLERLHRGERGARHPAHQGLRAGHAARPLRLAVQGVGGRFRQHFDQPWPAGRAARRHAGGDRPERASTAPPSPPNWQAGFRPWRLSTCICWSAKPARWTTSRARSISARRRRDVVFLSFSDSDLGAAAAAWQAMGADRPTLRLASLARLRHPMSVDLYVEQVIAHARVRGRATAGRARLLALRRAGDCRRLSRPRASRSRCCPAMRARIPGWRELCTAPAASAAMLDALSAPWRAGEPDAGTAAGGASGRRRRGRLRSRRRSCPRAGVSHSRAGGPAARARAGLAVIVFYRSHLLAGDMAPDRGARRGAPAARHGACGRSMPPA